MKKISIITPVYNEAETVRRCHAVIAQIMGSLSDRYEYEHLFGDNCSTDNTLEILREIAASDPHVRVLAYSRNFGAEKSSFTLLSHMSGDAVVGMPADLQEPPEMIPVFVEMWEKGVEVVSAVYANRSDSWVMARVRKFYYWIAGRLTGEQVSSNYTGFGLIDRVVINEVIRIKDYDPFIRGLITNIGFRQATVPYERAPRKEGRSKHNFSFLFGFGINAIISYSVAPIRIATVLGICLSGFSLLMSVVYTIIKLVNWHFQAPGATTTIVLVLFFSGIQLFFLGVLGEYIGAIHNQVRPKPFVIIRERINFDDPT